MHFFNLFCCWTFCFVLGYFRGLFALFFSPHKQAESYRIVRAERALELLLPLVRTYIVISRKQRSPMHLQYFEEETSVEYNL